MQHELVGSDYSDAATNPYKPSGSQSDRWVTVDSINEFYNG